MADFTSAINIDKILQNTTNFQSLTNNGIFSMNQRFQAHPIKLKRPEM